MRGRRHLLLVSASVCLVNSTIFLTVVHIDYSDVLDEVGFAVFSCLISSSGSGWLRWEDLDGTLLWNLCFWRGEGFGVAVWFHVAAVGFSFEGVFLAALPFLWNRCIELPLPKTATIGRPSIRGSDLRRHLYFTCLLVVNIEGEFRVGERKHYFGSDELYCWRFFFFLGVNFYYCFLFWSFDLFVIIFIDRSHMCSWALLDTFLLKYRTWSFLHPYKVKTTRLRKAPLMMIIIAGRQLAALAHEFFFERTFAFFSRIANLFSIHHDYVP